MFHCEFQCAVAARGGAADSARYTRRIDAICGFDHGDEFRDDHVFPFFAAVAGIRVKAVCGRWQGDDELADLSFGNPLIQFSVGLPECTPSHFVLEGAVKEIQHGIFLGRRSFVRRREVYAVANVASQDFALK